MKWVFTCGYMDVKNFVFPFIFFLSLVSLTNSFYFSLSTPTDQATFESGDISFEYALEFDDPSQIITCNLYIDGNLENSSNFTASDYADTGFLAHIIIFHSFNSKPENSNATFSIECTDGTETQATKDLTIYFCKTDYVYWQGECRRSLVGYNEGEILASSVCPSSTIPAFQFNLCLPDCSSTPAGWFCHKDSGVSYSLPKAGLGDSCYAYEDSCKTDLVCLEGVCKCDSSDVCGPDQVCEDHVCVDEHSDSNTVSQGSIIFGLGISIMSALIALAWAFSKAFSLPLLSAWAKEQTSALISTTLIALAVFSILQYINPTISLFITQDTVSHTNVCYSDNLINYTTCRLDSFSGEFGKSYERLSILPFKLGRYAGFFASYSTAVPFGPAVSKYESRSPGSGFFGTTYSTASMIMDFLATSYFYIRILRLVILWSAYIGPLLLPFALFLRLFPTFRKPASLFIAILLSMLIFLPLSVVLFFNVYDVYTDQIGGSAYDKISAGVSEVRDSFFIKHLFGLVSFLCSKWINIFAGLTSVFWLVLICLITSAPTFVQFGACIGIDTGIGWKLIMDPTTMFGKKGIYDLILTTVSVVTGNAISYFASDDMFKEIQNQAIRALSEYIVPGAVQLGVAEVTLTLMVAIITISSIRSVSQFIGGGVYLFGLQKIV